MPAKKTTTYFFSIVVIFSTAFALYFEFNHARTNYLQSNTIEEGVVDFYNFDFAYNELYGLAGEAEFYWEELLTPGDFKDKPDLKPTGYIKLPGIWNDFYVDGEKIGGTGYATYRFKIQVPDNQQYGLKIKEFDTAYEIWINGKHAGGAGKVGTSRDNTIPGWQRKEFFFYSDQKLIDVVIQVANFVHRKGGAEDIMFFGNASALQRVKKRELIINAVVYGVLLILVIYHLIMFVYRPKELTLLLFSLMCFFMGVRLLTTGEKLLLEFFPNINFIFAIRLEYVSYKIVLPLMLSFLHQFYPNYFSKTIVKVVSYITGAFVLFIFITPIHIFSYTPIAFQVIGAVVAIYILSALSIAAYRKEAYTTYLWSGYVIFFLMLINDILYYNNLFETSFLMHYGLFILAISHSIVLSRQFSLAFLKIELLTEKLARYNQELEEKVARRTQQIEEQKDKLVHSANELGKANAQLKELTAFKESLMEMIIHDLKNPLNIVLNFSKDERVIYAGNQMLHLVHNLLDVQKYEHSSMNLNLETISLNKILENSMAQVNYIAKEKNIRVRYQLPNDFHLHVDPDVISRVFVNLLSNALRFTPNEGNMSVRSFIADGNVSVCIKDSGPGIPHDQKDLVFQKFGQYLIRRAGKSGSTGVGLTFCKMAMEAHKGKISFSSELGKGTSFCCEFPEGKLMDNPEVVIENSISEIKDLVLNKREKNQLKRILIAIQEAQVYEISKINKVLAKLSTEESENITLWVKLVKKSLINGNQSMYEKLIKLAS